MRLLGVLALAAPVALGILLVAVPEVAASWVDTVSRSVIAAVAAATIGVSITAGSLYLLMRIRLGRRVKAAETWPTVQGVVDTSHVTSSYQRKSGTKYTCMGSQTDSTGTFSFTATVAKTPTH
jgi:hypothetical protein